MKINKKDENTRINKERDKEKNEKGRKYGKGNRREEIKKESKIRK